MNTHAHLRDFVDRLEWVNAAGWIEFDALQQLTSCSLLSLSLYQFAGHCCIHQEGVRQEVQPHVALHRRPQLWLVCDTRNTPLHLLLPGSGGRAALQERLGMECGRFTKL